MKNQLIFTLMMAMLSVFFAKQVQAVSCGDNLTRDATLTADLNCTSSISAIAIQITADNVTLNLNGFTISGSSDMVGIDVYESNHVNIVGNGGAIKGFWAGILAQLSDDLHVSGTTFYDLGRGAVINSGNDGLIENNAFIYINNVGVTITNTIVGKGIQASNNIVNNNEFYKNRSGIRVCGEKSDNNIIKNNLIWKSNYAGIEINHSDRNKLHYNNILETDTTAIRLYNSSYNNIRSNSLRDGNIGLSVISANDPRCLGRDPGSSKLSFKNTFTKNHAIKFHSGISVGLGLTGTRNVFNNYFNDNKLYNDEIGISFGIDAHNNEAVGNVFTGTVTQIIDDGVGNSY